MSRNEEENKYENDLNGFVKTKISMNSNSDKPRSFMNKKTLYNA